MGVASLDLQQTDVGQGFIDYGRIINKPKINGVTLEGNLSTEDINIFIPQRVSELQNDAGYITKNVNDLVYYYDKTEVDNMISTIPKFDIKVVDALPTEDISPTTIYLLMVEGEDHFEEYIYVDDEWDKLGDGNIDLSDYATYEYVDSELAEKVDAADLATVALSGRYSDLIGVPTNLSQFTNDTGFITAASLPTRTSDLTNDGEDGTSTYVESNELATVATSGSYNDLTDTPTIDFELVEMSYGESNAWAKFIAAYQGHKIVYCRASSNSNPATGTQGRKAFMAYVNDAENPTEVEFQYVRSVSTKTSSQPVDQVFIYKLTNANGGTWSVQTRDMGPKLAQGTNTTVSYSNGTYTISAAQPAVNDATLTIQKNGTTVETFTANSSTNKTANIVVPTKTSDITNDSDFVNSTQVGTALAAYTYPSQDLYTQSDIDTMLAQISSLKIEVVNALPQTGNADTIYLLRVRQQGNDIYQEYFWVNNAWELIGGIDLTDYYTKTEVNTLLTAKADVSAIPTKTSDLTNDSNFAVDANYVHTDNNYTTAEKNKLAGIAAGAEVNVQSDWNQTTTTADDFIKNKPSIPTKTSDLTNDSGFITTAAIPTNVSAFNNDAGYLDEIPDDSVGLNQLDSTVVNALNNINNKANTADLAAVAFSGDYDDLSDKPTIPTKTSDLQNDGSDGNAAYLETDETAYKTASIPYGVCDGTSTSTVFTATVPGVTELRDGVCMWLKNGVVTSASGFTININNLGAKPVYSNMAAATRDTTIWNINYTMFFVYDSTRVSGGCWILYRGYNSDNNTIGYQLRTNSTALTTTDRTRYYRLLFTSADNTHWVPANTQYDNSATSNKTVNQRKINPFGRIVYLGNSTSYLADATITATAVWDQYAFNLGYSFAKGSALTMTFPKPVYIKCAPQSDGSAIIDSTTPYVQDLPSTEDGKIYIYLGIAYSATNVEMVINHPIYYYKDGAIREWTNATAGIASVAWGDITGTLSNQTDLNTALGAKANSADLATVATSGSYTDLTDKPTIPTVNNATLTIQKNSTNVATFTANASSNVTANISVPTATSDLTNDSGFLTNSTLPVATSNSLGVVQVGSGLTVSSGGVLSATGGGVADSVAWGHITGTLADQTDLQDELDAKANAADLATVATSGSYNDLTNKPTIPTVNNATLTIQKNSTSVGTFTANASQNNTINITVPTTAADVSALPDSTKYASSLTASINTTTYVMTLTLKDQDGNTLGTAQTIDLPLESVVVNGSYDSTNKKIVLTLQSGSTIDIPVGDLIAGLQSEITSTNKLDSDLVDDTGQTNKFMTSAEKTKLSGIAAGAEVNVQSDWNQTTTTADDYIKNKPSLATVATSGSYNDLSNKPTIPTVNNATLTIQKNGTTVKTFTANASSNVTANITVPTKTSDITNDSNFVASGDLATVATSGSYNDLTNKPTIPAAQVQSNWTQTTTTAVDYIKNKPTLATVATSGSYNDLSNKPTIPTVNNATLTIQKNGTNVQTFTANQSTNATANIVVPTKTSDLTNDSGFLDSVAWGDVTGKPTFATVATSGSYNDLSNKPTIPTVNNATLTIQKNGTNVQTFTANQGTNATANITVPTTVLELSDSANYATTAALASKQDTLIAGDHIDITSNTISATDYVHSEQPVAASAVTPVVTGSMISDGTITADKLASGATVKLTLSTSDIGEGAALAANTLYGVYI